MICSLAQMVVDFLWSRGPRLFGVYFGYLVGAGWRGNALSKRLHNGGPKIETLKCRMCFTLINARSIEEKYLIRCTVTGSH
jgi:hypothetical protein